VMVRRLNIDKCQWPQTSKVMGSHSKPQSFAKHGVLNSDSQGL